MQGTLQAFNQKGLKFTMDDIAKILGISKKTIYTLQKIHTILGVMPECYQDVDFRQFIS